MRLNLDRVKQKIAPYQGLSQFEYVGVNQQLGKSHTHNILTRDIIESPKFKSYLNSNTLYFQSPQFWDYGWEKIADKLLILEKSLSGKNISELEEKDFYPFVDLLIEYFFVKIIRLPGVCNFNPWKFSTPEKLQELSLTFENVTKLYPLIGSQDLTNQNIIDIYRPIYINGWGCVEIGEYDAAIYLSKFLYDLSNLDINSPELNIKIPQAPSNHPYSHKPKFSSGLILAKAYSGKGDIENALKVYKELLNVPQYHQGAYSFLTRRLEVAVEIYNLSPNDENKNLVLEWFLNSCLKDITPSNYTQERTREKCLIVLFLLKSLYNYKIK